MFIDLKNSYIERDYNYFWVHTEEWDSYMYPIFPEDQITEERYWLCICDCLKKCEYKVTYLNKFPVYIFKNKFNNLIIQ